VPPGVAGSTDLEFEYTKEACALRKSIIGGAAIAATLALAGTAQADTVQSISTAPWSEYNPSTVTKTQDGVRFGTYADGGATGGILRYTLDKPVKLSGVTDASYQFNYNQAGESPNAVPFLKLYLDNGRHVMLDPTDCNNTLVNTNEDESLSMTADDAALLYDDDGCGPNAHHLTWREIVAQHGDENVVKVVVMQGFSGGTDLSALLKSFTINGETFDFTGAPKDGQDGASGHDGVNGTNGVNGATGAAGKDGVTKVVYVNNTKLHGNRVRTIHAPSVDGWKLIKVRASLGAERLHTHGRTIKVDLRNKGVGAYNVRMRMQYKDKRGDRHAVRTVRTLSITRS
jgi:hypothetical protein